MTEIGAYQAKTHLPRLLRAVERGETVIITRRGRPIAKLAPIDDATPAEIAAALTRIEALRQRLPKMPLEEILAARHEGHKY